MADCAARALERTLNNNTHSWRSRMKLCHRIFFSRRLKQMKCKNKVLLDWLLEACNKTPCEEHEKSFSNAVKVYASLLKSAAAQNENQIPVDGDFLPSNLVEVLMRWSDYALTASKSHRLSKLLCSLWRYCIENGLVDQHFQQNNDQYIIFLSILIKSFVKHSIESNTDPNFSWIFNWSLEVVNDFKRSTLNNLDMLNVGLIALKPTLSILLESSFYNRLDKDLFSKIKHAAGVLLFPMDIELKVKQVLTFVFVPGSQTSTYLAPILFYLKNLIASVKECGIETISLFYDILLEKCRHLSLDMKLYLFLLSIRILGIDLKSCKVFEDLEIRGERLKLEYIDNEDSLRSLCCILNAAKRYISLIADDNSSGFSPLQYFQELVEHLLDIVKTRGCLWYKCIQHLLNLNCRIISPRSGNILKEVMTPILPVDEDVLAEQNLVLCQLLETYAKLSQLPKLMLKLFKVLEDDGSAVLLPRPFFQTFENIVLSMPLNSSLDVWQILARQIPDLINHVSVSVVADLLNCLLISLRVIDVSLPAATTDRLVQLSYNTADSCLARLIALSIADTNKVATLQSSLQLALNWGEMHMSLLYFNQKYKEGWKQFNIDAVSQSSFEEFSFIHFYLNSDDWDRIWTIGNSNTCPVVQHFCREFVLQKLKLLVNMNTGNAKKDSVCLLSGTEFLTQCESLDSADGEWNRDVTIISDENISTAIWSLICRYLNVLKPYLNFNSANIICEALVTTFEWKDNQPCESGSIKYLSQMLIDSMEFKESKVLQSSLNTAILKSCSAMLKKAAEDKNLLVQKVSKLFAKLSDHCEIWLELCDDRPANNDVQCWAVVEKSSSLINKILILTDTQATFLQSNQILSIFKRFKLLNALPLEYFLPCNQIRCLMATCAATALLIAQSNVTKRAVAAVQLGISNILCILDGKETSWIFKFIDSSALFTWLFRFLFPFVSKLENGEFKEIDDVLIVLLKRDCELLLENLIILVKKDEEQLQIFGNFLSQIEFFPKATAKFNLNYSILLLRTLHKKSDRSKLESVWISYQQDMLIDYFNWALKLTEKDLFELVERDSKKLSGVLESFSFSILVNSETLIPSSTYQKLVRFAHDVASYVVSNTRDASCIRQCCSILSHVANESDLKKIISKSDVAFQETWMAMEKLFALDVTDFDAKMLSSFIQSCSLEEFKWVVERLLHMVQSKHSSTLLVAFRLLNQIVAYKLRSEDKQTCLFEYSEQYFISFKTLIEECWWEFISDIFDVQTSLCKTAKLTRTCLLLCLDSCSKLFELIKDVPSKILVSMLEALNEMLNSQKHLLNESVDSFVRVVNRVLQAVIRNSVQDTLKLVGDEQISEASFTARRLQGLLGSISKSKDLFSSTIQYIILVFVKESSNVTLYPSIKTLLNDGIYELMNLKDKHLLAFNENLLDASGKEVFRVLYNNHKKYHAYKGKV